MKIKEYIKQNLDMLLLISGTVPLTYQYLTGLLLPELLYLCSVASAIALEVVIVKQVQQQKTSIYGTFSIIISSLFLVLISFAYYVPAALLEAAVIQNNEYLIIKALLEAIIHSVFALLILSTAFSKRFNNQNEGVLRHIKQYTAHANEGFVCSTCGKVFNTQRGLNLHRKKVHNGVSSKHDI